MARRNVLLTVVDQWRADFVPQLGTRFPRTPNLNRRCREGVAFRNHVTNTVPFDRERDPHHSTTAPTIRPTPA